MKNIMICKNKERETMCFRGFLERLLNIPFSEKQNIYAIEEVHADAQVHSDSRWMHKCIRIPVGCVGASGLPDNADQCRFPDKGGGFLGLWCKTDLRSRICFAAWVTRITAITADS